MPLNQDVRKACVAHIIERIGDIQRPIKRKSLFCRILFTVCCLSVAVLCPSSSAIMAAARLDPVAIGVATMLQAGASLSLAWWLYIAVHTYDTDDAICEKAKGSLTLLEMRFQASNSGGKQFQEACEIVLQEILTGVVRPLGFGIRLPPMPQTPITDQLIAVLSSHIKPSKPGDGKLPRPDGGKSPKSDDAQPSENGAVEKKAK